MIFNSHAKWPEGIYRIFQESHASDVPHQEAGIEHAHKRFGWRCMVYSPLLGASPAAVSYIPAGSISVISVINNNISYPVGISMNQLKQLIKT